MTTPNGKGTGIAIIGLGGCFPGASNIPTFWQNILAGTYSIREVPSHRWDTRLWFDTDRQAPEKSYSRIGGFLDEIPFEPKRFRIPPRTLKSVDDVQKLALTAVAEALQDAGLKVMPRDDGGRDFDRARCAVILGNAMGGEYEDLSSLRVWFPTAVRALEGTDFSKLDPAQKAAIISQFESEYKADLPDVNEDTMPGELSNCIAGRVANAFDLRGANFTCDAACAASMAALKSAVSGLLLGDFDMAIAGGVDRSMDPPSYVKFSKIGALSANGSMPFDKKADGFVMGEGGGVLVLKRLADAERDGDKIYAVIRGVGAASDGKGKGMTAPNPRGQKVAVQRAYEEAGFGIDTVGLFEAHGTSTVVGDATELRVLTDLLKEEGAQPEKKPVGSVKSMIGHLKSAAAAASLIKTTLAVSEGKIPPSAKYEEPTEDSPLYESYLRVPTSAQSWASDGRPRRAGVSAFGFGGTNFHAVLEEYTGKGESVKLPPKNTASTVATATATASAGASAATSTSGVLAEVIAEVIELFADKTGYDKEELEPDYHLEADLGIDTVKQAEIMGVLREKYSLVRDESFKLSDTPTLEAIAGYIAGRLGERGETSAPSAQAPAATAATSSFERVEGQPVVLVFGGKDRDDLIQNAQVALSSATSVEALAANSRAALRANVRVAFAASSIEEARTKAVEASQGRARRLAAQGIFLGEGAPKGKTAFLFPGQGSQYLGMFQDLAEVYPVVAETFAEAEQILEPLINGKLTDLVWAKTDDEEARKAADLVLRRTEICQPAMLAADTAMLRLLNAHGVRADMVAGHSLGEYAAAVAAGVLSFKDALYAVSARGREMAHIKVADNGQMATVAAGADRVEELLADIDDYVIAANKNCHAQTVIAGSTPGVRKALVKLAELNIDARNIPVSHAFHSKIVAPAADPLRTQLRRLNLGRPQLPILSNVTADYYPDHKEAIVELMGRQIESSVEFIAQLQRMYDDGARTFIEVGPRRALSGFVANVLQKEGPRPVPTNHHKKGGLLSFAEALASMAAEGLDLDFGAGQPTALFEVIPALEGGDASTPAPRLEDAGRAPQTDADAPVISGVSVAVPTDRAIGEEGEDLFARLLGGENFIRPLTEEQRQKIADQKIVRLDKTTGDFVPLSDAKDVLKLAARLGGFDLVDDYGIDKNFDDALDATGRLAIAVGLEALKDAGLPLVRRYRTTSTGKKLPDRWGLPDELAATTGVIFASCFPSHDRMVDEVSKHVSAKFAGETAGALQDLVDQLAGSLSNAAEAERVRATFAEKIDSLKEQSELYAFNRKFLMRVLAMGHAQLAQTILAQGPNTQLNTACASGTQAIGVATDWIARGRCERVLVVSADHVTHESFLPFSAAGFLATGAATIEEDVSRAAVPFGKHRNGMILGAGASGFVVEKDSSVLARGIEPIANVLLTRFVNSAFHATRLDAAHVQRTVDEAVGALAAKLGLSRAELAQNTLFMSHETYTPARGGSSAAEVNSLREAFGDAVKDLLISNTKGYTGHPMGASLEDVVALKGLQRQVVPAIANLDEVDPAFADLRFSDGGAIDSRYAIRFAAGFGSQLAMSAYERRARSEERLVDAERYDAWLAEQLGRADAGLEVFKRTLRVAEQGGRKIWELGIRSLERAPVEAEIAAAPVPAVEAPAPVAAAAAVAVPRQTLMTEVTALFAAQTGYEVEDFEPGFELEADLGVDTVKQAEIFSLIREKFGLPRDESFRLSDMQTLDAVVDYVHGRMGAAAAAAPSPSPSPVSEAAPAPVTQPVAAAGHPAPVTQPVAAAGHPAPVAAPVGAGRDQMLREVTALFAEQTGYDVEDFEPAFELEADLGIDTVKQAEIFSLLRERFGLPKDESFKLSDVQTLDAVVDYVLRTARAPSDEPAPVVEAPPAAPAAHPAAAPVAVIATTPGRDAMMVEITALFAEQTGYDVEDFEAAFELEADLGIDTVKQAEIFSLIRERYRLPKDESFKLSDVQTLDAVVDYVLATMAGGPEPQPPADRAPVVPAEVIAEAATTPPPAPGVGVGVGVGAATATADRTGMMVEITALFAEQTGYDVEDFEPAFELEADLGIDTVKQAEIFSLIRQRYHLPKDEAFRLSDVQTLDAVVDYVLATAAGAPAAPAAAAEATPEPAVTLSERPDTSGINVWRVRTEAVTLPEPIRELTGRRIVVAGGDDAWRSAVRAALTRRGAQVHLLQAGLEPHQLENRLSDLGGAAADDVVYLAGDRDALDIPALQERVVEAFQVARAFARARGEMRDAGWLTLGRSGGAFGFDAEDATGLLLGALSGLAKTLSKEWLSEHVSTVDLDTLSSVADGVEAALDGWLADAACEIGFDAGKTYTLVRETTAVPAGESLTEGSVVVATGGARGVTYEIIRKLAERSALRVVVLARTQAVARTDSPLFEKTEAEQKDLARAALSVANERVTPAAVRRWISKEESRIEVAENLDALRALGSTAQLIRCDVSDSASLSAALAEISTTYGTVDLVIHGAGLEESKMLPDKDPGAITRTFVPKASAALALHSGLKPRRMLTMGSIAGRFGNGGQADYAAANELMAALARDPARNVTNVGWTAWGDVGMATRGSVRQVLESLGVSMMPADVGSTLGADICAAGGGDLVVAGALGELTQTEGMRRGASGEALPWIFDRTEADGDATVYVRDLDVHRDPGLDHHRIDGVAVLPGVLGVELMQQAAAAQRGEQPTALEDVRFSVPLKLFRDEPLEARVEARTAGATVELKLVTHFRGPGGKIVRREHFSARASFAVGAPEAPARLPLELPRDPAIGRDDIYQRYFHGPRFQVLGRVLSLGEDGIEAAPASGAQPWVGTVEHGTFATAPYLRETGFQAAGLWEMAELGRMALPAGVDHLQLGSTPPAGAQLEVEARLVEAKDEGSVFDVWVRDRQGRVYDVMRGYRTATLRDLSAGERFEPARPQGKAPDSLDVSVDVVRSLLRDDADATTRRYLSPQERGVHAALKSEKRRVEWLAGRIAAKRLLRQRRFANEGAIVPYGAISILADDLGAPQVAIVGEPTPGPRLSITHSAGVAAAFASPSRSLLPGIDVEKVEARDVSFGKHFFTEDEQAAALGSENSHQTLTAIWAVKEAMVKALGIGARVDLREVVVLPSGSAWSVTLTGEAQARAKVLGAGVPQIEVSVTDERVTARVLLPSDVKDGQTRKSGTTEVSL